MKTNKSIFGFKITSFNQEKKECNLTVMVKHGDSDPKSKNFKGVKLSSLLYWNLTDVRGSENINTEVYYESDNNSPDFKANPFQLIKYSNKDGKEQFLLTLVTEDKPGKPKEIDPFGTKAMNFKYHSKGNFKRYRNRTTKVKA